MPGEQSQVRGSLGLGWQCSDSHDDGLCLRGKQRENAIKSTRKGDGEVLNGKLGG